MELTNKERQYLGLELIEPSWERLEIPNNTDKNFVNGKCILYFAGDILRKSIEVTDDGSLYKESSCHIKTENNHTIISPITSKGKARKLNCANLSKCSYEGMYFLYYNGKVLLANYTTEQTYYDSELAGIKKMNVKELHEFIQKWISETTTKDLKKINDFVSSKRKHCKFKEGDFFRFSIDRTNYGYGRILLDISLMRKNKEKFWDILAFKPLVISVYHIITDNPNVDITTLKKLKRCPSQFISDNRFFYGEYEIIGHEELNAEELDYPIMYGLDLDYLFAKDNKLIKFQMGHTYKEITFDNNNLIQKSEKVDIFLQDFINNGIGYNLNINKNILEECIAKNSNEPYWHSNYNLEHDLRHPNNINELQMVLKQMNISKDKIKCPN